jgi:hypothetical protein
MQIYVEPNTINFLFQILLFYFEELKKKTNSNIAGRTVSALLTEELLVQEIFNTIWQGSLIS